MWNWPWRKPTSPSLGCMQRSWRMRAFVKRVWQMLARRIRAHPADDLVSEGSEGASGKQSGPVPLGETAESLCGPDEPDSGRAASPQAGRHGIRRSSTTPSAQRRSKRNRRRPAQYGVDVRVLLSLPRVHRVFEISGTRPGPQE